MNLLEKSIPYKSIIMRCDSINRNAFIDFLDSQKTTIEGYDEGLVRKLIERVIVHEDCSFTVEFKSGTQVEIA